MNFSIGNGARVGLLLVTAGLVTGCGGGLDGGPLLRPGEVTGTIRLVNQTNYTLDAAVMSDCGNSTYGFNRIESGNGIPPGQYRDFTVSVGCWDVGGGAIGVGHTMQRLQVTAGGISQYTLTS